MTEINKLFQNATDLWQMLRVNFRNVYYEDFEAKFTIPPVAIYDYIREDIRDE
jgi:hypothetical protein